MMIKLLSLFSGIGAFEKALERQGIEYQLVNYCEIDKYSSKSYSLIHNVSEQMNLGDITKIDTLDMDDNVDFITYGFPCQDISLAGKQKGFEQNGELTRSGLFFEALRIIEGTKPKVAICENVKNLTSKRFSKEFSIVLQSLEEAGYNNYWQVLNAKDYGIPQNRERVFIVSIRKDIDNGSFEFPKPFELELRLKDMLEDQVDEKYYLSEDIQKRFKFTDDTFTKSIVGTTKPDFRTIGQRDLVYQENGVMGALVATDYKQPKQILETKRLGGVFDTEKSKHQAGSVWDKDGLSPTLDTMQGGWRQPCILVKENNKAGYKVAHEGDGINISSRMKWQRGNVQKQLCHTITTSSGNDRGVVTTDYRIRKLTPRECFRLMGFDDSDFDKVEGNLSNTQLYKQAGNSIVVNVLEEIYKELFKSISPDKISASERLPEKKYESTLFAEAVAHCEKIVINGKVVKGK